MTSPKGEVLTITFEEILSDVAHEMGIDPGLQKDGVEAHLQKLLGDDPTSIQDGLTLVRREIRPTSDPSISLCRDGDGVAVAVEVKRRGEIDGVEQLTRYLDFLNRDPLLRPVRGVFVAQEIKPQAKVLASDRDIGWVEVDSRRIARHRVTQPETVLDRGRSRVRSRCVTLFSPWRRS